MGGGGRAGLALVTFQCQMQIERRHGLPGMRQPIGRRECGPGGRRRRQTKTQELGARGSLPAKAGGDSPGSPGGAAGRAGGAEVVVGRNGGGRRLITGRTASRGPGGEAAGLRVGLPRLLRSPAGLGVSAPAAAGLAAQIGTFKQLIVTSQRGPPAPRHWRAARRPIPGCGSPSPPPPPSADLVPPAWSPTPSRGVPPGSATAGSSGPLPPGGPQISQ